MKRSLLLLTVLSFIVLVPLASAASWQNQDVWTGYVSNDVAGALTITPGASGAWETGGYNFNGTAYATRSGFKPLYNESGLTIVMTLRLNSPTQSFKKALSQYSDSTNSIEVVTHKNERIYVDFTVGGTNYYTRIDKLTGLNYTVPTTIVWTWASGDVPVLYGFQSGVQVSYNASVTGAYTGSTAFANAQLYLGSQTGGSAQTVSTISYLAVYDTNMTTDEIGVIGALGPDVVYGSPLYYWTLNEGEGSVFLPGNPAWVHQTFFSLSAVSSAPYVPAWLSQDQWIAYPDVAAPVVDISPFLPPWFSLLGLILVPASMSYPFVKKRMTGDLEFNDVGTAMLMFFLGLAFLIGSVV